MPKENLEKRQKSPSFILKTCNIKVPILKRPYAPTGATRIDDE